MISGGSNIVRSSLTVGKKVKELLEVRSVTKRFGSLVVIDNLSFSICKGETLGLIGPNGAGKTTLFNLISGYYRPDQGKITFLGRDISTLEPHEICEKGIARTFQLVKPFSKMTVFDNIVVGALLRTKGMEKARAEAEDIIEMVGLNEAREAPAKNLTMAKRKLLELARSIATKPKLLLVDEVVAGLNAEEIDEVLALLKRIKSTGVTLCLVEHVMKAIMSVSDRILVLDRGAKVAEGSPEEVSIHKGVIQAYLGRAYA